MKSPQEICVDILTRILDQFTYHPENRKVWAAAVGRSWIIKIQLHRADTPRAVGERGSHVRALEMIAAAIGAKAGANIRTQLLEPEVGLPERYHKFKPMESWNSAEVKAIAEQIAEHAFVAPATVTIHDGEDFTSTLEIVVDRSENKNLASTMQQAMQVVFNAIGKANGRILVVDVVSS
jgi:predicted RNA-binding protein YlqC (UPF0109 family)